MVDDKKEEVAPKDDVDQKVDEGSKKEEAKKEDFNPGPDHPRFKEVYYRMKKAERELEENRKDVEALRGHSNQLAEALKELKDSKKSDEPEPDPIGDPEGYKAWHRLQMAKKDKENKEQRDKDRVAMQIEIESGLHPDYDDVIKVAEREMARNPAEKKKVWESSNVARAAYRLGVKLMEEDKKKEQEEEKRQERLDAGDLHKEAPAPRKESEPSDDLSQEEKRVIRNLFPQMEFKEAAKKYAEHKKLLGAGR